MSFNIDLRKLKLVCLVAIACSAVQSCKENDNAKPAPVELSVHGRVYNAEDNSIKINDKYVKNVYQTSTDEKGRFTIYSEVENSAQPNLKLLNITTNTVQILTDSANIEFDPVVNSKGQFAYALHEYSVGASRIFLNNKAIELPVGLYKSLAINDLKLAFNRVDSVEDRNVLYIYDLETLDLVQLELPLITTTIAFSSLDKLIIEGLSIESNRNMIILVDTTNISFQVISDKRDSENCYLESYQWEEAAKINCLSRVHDVEKIFLHMAMRDIQTKDPLLALACSNNNLGRVSWNASYRLLTLLEIIGKAELKNIVIEEYGYPVSDVLKHAIDCLLSNTNFTISDEHFLWPTTKYSLDKTSKLSLLVDDSAILYPLIKAANAGLMTDKQKNQSIDLVNAYYELHDLNYDQDLRMYRFAKGIPYWADGIVLPWNMTNYFGLVMLEMHKLTKDEKYSLRVNEIASSFRSEWIFNFDNSVKWHYWPEVFYNGWESGDELSVNTPYRGAFVDELFEDVAHSGINVLFATEHFKTFTGQVFSFSDLESFKLTIDAIEYDGGYSAFISGDIDYLPASRRFTPSFGWVDYIDYKKIINGHPNYYPLFEGGFEFDYIKVLTNQ